MLSKLFVLSVLSLCVCVRARACFFADLRYTSSFSFVPRQWSLQDYVDAASHNVYQIGDCGDQAPPAPPPVCTPDPTPLACYDVSHAGCTNNTEHKTSAVCAQQPPSLLHIMIAKMRKNDSCSAVMILLIRDGVTTPITAAFGSPRAHVVT